MQSTHPRRPLHATAAPLPLPSTADNRTTELFRTVDSSHVVVRLAAVPRTTTPYPPYLCRPTPRADPDVQPPYSPFSPPSLYSPSPAVPGHPSAPVPANHPASPVPFCPSPTTECTPPPARLSSKQPSNPPPDSLSLRTLLPLPRPLAL
ncbi:hypothetical protein PUN28_003846 [Cardiocondyla obscurior]|uniref:Uncharacterized protein n=1 Tax=Cardiocondyla obscurior TaxID=286306 RepID=A0AAW2GN72_9HYME